MLDKLAAIHERYLGIERQINDPDVMSDMKAYIKLSKDFKELQPIIEGYKKFKVLVEGIEACRSILDEEKDEGEEDKEPVQIANWCCLPESDLLSAESREFLDRAMQALTPAQPWIKKSKPK